jgi:UDP-N-acetylglucosamine 2-epimerase (non-hydrolysing)
MKIISVVGARPNFMKIAPFIHAIERHNQLLNFSSNGHIDHILVHTGQHYDDKMSKTFFETLKIPQADINLGVGSGTHAEQVGRTMIEFEKVVKSENPDWVVVVGDVNATLACSVTAKKENIRCAHIEAGLRSGDMSMPEEVNRLVTDRLSDLLFTPDRISNENLIKEGVTTEKIKFVGNIMIDTLDLHKEKASLIELSDIICRNSIGGSNNNIRLKDDDFGVVTLHRPSNVDVPEIITQLIYFFTNQVASNLPLLWTLHPRTRKQIQSLGLWDTITKCKNLTLLEPLDYLDMLRLNMGAKVILTDSGGLQEESTVLGTPCLTLRWNTERPVTLKEHGGASVLVGNNIDRIKEEYSIALLKERMPMRPDLWDGKTAERIVETFTEMS